MHYIANGYIIESELAAKSTIQTNDYVLDFINNLPSNSSVLDYGCGKLRYAIPLAKHVSEVVAIDSIFQIDKQQRINGEITTPRKFKLNNLIVESIDEGGWKKKTYNVILCTNVLSAIPSDLVRLEVFHNIKSVLSKNGYAFISVQYRNSYFSQYASRKNAVSFHDGWLLPRNKNKYSFYGLITIEKIKNLCDESGLTIFEIDKKDGSLFVKVKVS